MLTGMREAVRALQFLEGGDNEEIKAAIAARADNSKAKKRRQVICPQISMSQHLAFADVASKAVFPCHSMPLIKPDPVIVADQCGHELMQGLSQPSRYKPLLDFSRQLLHGIKA